MQPIIQLAKELAEIRKDINAIEDSLKPLKVRRDELQAELIKAMKENELKSLKTDDYNFARTVKKDFRVIDESQVMEDLKARNEYENYVKPKIDIIGLKAYQKSLLEGAGEILNGVEPTETEYMSIKTLNAHKENRD